MTLLCLMAVLCSGGLRAERGFPDHWPCYPKLQATASSGTTFETSSAEWSWSPCGRWVAFDRAIAGTSQLRIIEVASGSERCISSGECHDSQPSWSPDGNSVAFVRRHETGQKIGFLDLEDGSTQWLEGTGQEVEYPVHSHDGSLLAYVQSASPGSRNRFVVVRELPDGPSRVIFDSSFGLNNLSFRPDDRAVILYSIDADGWNDLYEAAVDGSSVRRLTDNTVTDSYSASYSLDGEFMVFGQGAEASPYHRWFNYDLYQRSVATGGIRRLTWSLGADDRAKFSPDQRSLGFMSRRTGYAELFLMNTDASSGLRRLTRQPDGELSQRVLSDGLAATIQQFDAVRETFPEARMMSEAAVLILVHQLLGRGQQEDAVDFGRLGVDTYPDSWRVRTALGQALLMAGEVEESHEQLRESLLLFPNQVPLVGFLGQRKFLDLLDSVEGVYRDRGLDVLDLVDRLARRGDVLTGVALLQRLSRAHPEDGDVLEAVGDLHRRLGDHGAAVAAYGELLSLIPEHPRAQFHRQRLRPANSQ